jgi:hypothetical protein
VFAADSADIGHMAPISADGQAAFAGDFALLLSAHCRKTAPTLLGSSGSAFGGCASPHWASARSTATRLAGPATAWGGSTAGRFLIVILVHAPAAAAASHCA